MRSLPKWFNPKRLAIFEACLVGVLAGIAAVLLKQGIGWIGGWRIQIANDLPAWIALPLIGLTGGFLSGFLIEKLGKEAAGSGVPQVKAALSYVPIALNLRVALVKIASTILALGSGLALGRQGPTVQIGAAIAGQVSQWIPTSPEYQRQLIAAGAAAGLAAGFNAPIAGVLFVIEELLHDVSSLTLGTAILASFIGGVVSLILSGQSFQPNAMEITFSAHEIPFLLFLGVLVGYFAALFNHGVIAVTRWNRNFFRMGIAWRIAIAGAVSGMMIAMLPQDFRDSTGLQLFLATGQSDWHVTTVTFIVRFLLTLIACSAETSGGLFVPSLILGAALGTLIGNFEHATLGMGTTTTYALAGMGAFFGAVAKVPITAFVIVFELTRNFNIILPLMITSVVAYLYTEKYAPGSLYTHLLELKGIHLEAETVTDALWDGIRAVDVMQKEVETLDSETSINDVMQAFGRSRHRGFPVVNDDHLVGIITQMDLVKAQQSKIPLEVGIGQIMTPNPITVSPEESLSQVLYLLSYYKLSRLPVVDQAKLIGIITRSDILRAQAKRLRGVSSQTSRSSYRVYQQRGPATGRGRLLLPLSDTPMAMYLLQIALAIAERNNYELECLHIIPIAPHLDPATTPVNLESSLAMLQKVRNITQTHKVSLHTEVYVSHDVAQAILEVSSDRQIDLLLMGWHGKPSSPDHLFGDTVHTMIKQANCDLMLVKFGDLLQKTNPFNQEFRRPNISFNRWLIPIAGGPNTQSALKFMPAFMSLSPYPEICLCQIFSPSDEESLLSAANKQLPQSVNQLQKYADTLYKSLRFSVGTISVCSNSITDAILDLADQERSDVIMLGATKESLLQQMLHGNIPEAIARHSNRTVIIFRKAI